MTDKTDSKERAGRFTKKPVTIDAWLIDFGNKPLPDWVNEAFRTEAIDWCPAGEGLYINTLEGHMLGANGSWLIKGVQGELYACKPDIFAATYERASLAPSGFDAADMATASAQGFRDGVASLAASAGSEADMRAVVAVAVTMLFDSHPEDVRRTFTIAELSDMVRITEALGKEQVEDIYKRAWDGISHPSPPEGMVGGWTKASQQLPPCRDDQLYLGVNTAGFAGVFNAVVDIAGDVHCMYETPEETIDVMSSLDIWQPFTPPTTSAGSGKGE